MADERQHRQHKQTIIEPQNESAAPHVVTSSAAAAIDFNPPPPNPSEGSGNVVTHQVQPVAVKDIRATLGAGQRWNLRAPPVVEVPTNEYVTFLHWVLEPYNMIFEDTEMKYELFASWVGFRRGSPDATLPQLVDGFLEHLDGLRANPRFHPAARCGWPAITASSVIATLSGTERVIATAVRDVCDVERRYCCPLLRVFVGAVAELKLPHNMVKQLFVLWGVATGEEGAMRTLSSRDTNVAAAAPPKKDSENDRTSCSIKRFVLSRVRAMHVPAADSDECRAPNIVAQYERGRELQRKGVYDRTNCYHLYRSYVVNIYELKFNTTEADAALFGQWQWLHNNIPVSAPLSFDCVNAAFVMRLEGRVDPKLSGALPLYLEDESRATPAEQLLSLHLSDALDRRKQDATTRPFRDFLSGWRCTPLTRTSINILYALSGYAMGAEQHRGGETEDGARPLPYATEMFRDARGELVFFCTFTDRATFRFSF